MSNQSTDRDTGPLLALLDAFDGIPIAAELRTHSFDLLNVSAGTRLLDVGCGSGRAVGEAARLGARAFGVDPDRSMIAVAESRWPEGGFTVADAYALPYPDSSIDAYRADKVYHVLENPALALAEAYRVLVPGGRIVLIGQDWDAFVIDADDPALTRTIVHARADLVTGPRTARRYRALLIEAGYTDVRVEVRTGVFTDATRLPLLPMLTEFATAAHGAGAITAAQAEEWLDGQRRRAAEDRVFMAMPLFVADATRP
ncbi:methyltransferase domain-containing protein [Rhizohabitans arisaemae]|uniref:methyltransferase domain-containing protein n=1 Tax=Rhizohabitans arisaemae TaxID=2720610 RepID=UPI0024B09744|nr:methyltransferase domain-containing protein [Rhizohabitans arisaemae]